MMMAMAAKWDTQHMSARNIWWYLQGAKKFCPEYQWNVLNEMQEAAQYLERIEETRDV
jgi:hypothetical protein